MPHISLLRCGKAQTQPRLCNPERVLAHAMRQRGSKDPWLRFAWYQGMSSLVPQPAQPFFEKQSTRRSRAPTSRSTRVVLGEPALSGAEGPAFASRALSTPQGKTLQNGGERISGADCGMDRRSRDRSVDLEFPHPRRRNRRRQGLCWSSTCFLCCPVSDKNKFKRSLRN